MSGNPRAASTVSFLRVLWGHDVVSHAFVVVAGAALAALLVAHGRSKLKQSLHLPSFLAQLRRLVLEGTLARAINFSAAADATVTRVARAGLEAASAETSEAAGYRATAPGATAAAARAAMDEVRREMRAQITRGFVLARVLGATACALGGVVAARAATSGGATQSLYVVLVTAAIAALLGATWVAVRRHERSMGAVADTVEELVSLPGIRAR